MARMTWNEIPPQFVRAYEMALKTDFGADITGIDVGVKIDTDENGNRVWRSGDDELALRFFVNEKKSRSALTLSGAPLLPPEFEKVPTDVISARFNPVRLAPAEEQQAERENPIQPGISVSHGIVGAGTLGAIVYCKDNGAPALLSCWHVLAHEAARKGDPVFQPSPVDGGDPRFDAIGHLERWIADEDGDAAIAVLNKARMVTTAQRLSNATLGGARRAKIGETLEKVGRGTGRTVAWVDGIGRYQVTLTGGRRIWIDGFRLVPEEGAEKKEISAQGDSGAVWYSRAGGGVVEGVGLHVNGEVSEREEEHAIACHLETVLQRLGVSLTLPALRQKQMAAPEREKVYAWMEQNWDKLAALVAAFPKVSAAAGPGPGGGKGGEAKAIPLPPAAKVAGGEKTKSKKLAAGGQGGKPKAGSHGGKPNGKEVPEERRAAGRPQ